MLMSKTPQLHLARRSVSLGDGPLAPATAPGTWAPGSGWTQLAAVSADLSSQNEVTEVLILLTWKSPLHTLICPTLSPKP